MSDPEPISSREYRDGVHDAYRRYKNGEIDAEEACEVVERLRSQPHEPENRDDFSLLYNLRAEFEYHELARETSAGYLFRTHHTAYVYYLMAFGLSTEELPFRRFMESAFALNRGDLYQKYCSLQDGSRASFWDVVDRTARLLEESDLPRTKEHT
jgi:hypothetical protein